MCFYSIKLLTHILTRPTLACEQAVLFGRVKRVSRERASERRSREGLARRLGLRKWPRPYNGYLFETEEKKRRKHLKQTLQELNMT